MAFSINVLSILAVIAVGLSVLAVIVALIGAGGRRPDEDQEIPQGDRLEMLADAHAQAIKRLEDATRQLTARDKRLYELLQGTVQNVGVVRFDAFEDMGGRLSFSAALLDAHGDGVVVTSINGRQDTRCYAKTIRNATSIHNLSDEEEQAIREALSTPRQEQAVEAR